MIASVGREDMEDIIVNDSLRFAAPFRCVEHIRIVNCEDGLTLHATKVIDPTDPYLSGHFPDLTIFPGVFIIESLCQTVTLALGELEGLLPQIATLRSVRFLAPLFPGNRMTMRATIGPLSVKKTFEVDAQCQRNDGVMVARLKVKFRYGEIARA
jgi:3-hydroxyacyl-[acyl-carrier-protein] dehydratase